MEKLDLDYAELTKLYPDAMASLKLYTDEQSLSVLTRLFDNRGVRVYLKYGANGGHGVEVYRKKTKQEFKKSNPNKNLDVNWKMIRIGMIQSYDSRLKAYKAGVEEAFNQLQYLIENE